MDKKIAVFIVHGIGSQKKGFSEAIEKNLRSNFRNALRHMGEDHRTGIEDALLFKEGLWADIVQEGEDELQKRLFRDPDTDVDWLCCRRFSIDNFGDAISYCKGPNEGPYSQYRKIHERIGQLIKEISDQTHPSENTLLTVVSHSLGTVILSDYFYDTRNTLKPDRQLVFTNFFTLGSPISIYANRFYNCESDSDPFAGFLPQKVEDEQGVWVNIFDEDDIVGYPIRPINAHCREAVTADINIDVGSFLLGWTPFCHRGYWKNKKIGKVIAEKLAIDWLRVHGEAAETTMKRIGDYKKRYKMPES
ncbi:conserved hypothetical protein [Nitrospina gracilis 3/211]|uniref:Uncharacterized protein n=1 Tax=Nitrospina gracilis (strain 3/211) TaxID=1266370 RepID=M1YWX4_NITG3|nr:MULTISPECIES: hypothetical protein [Nitrospina]MCF8722385.1 hypothetical protein [Nitrospina sp. Nb-3]CCQ89999.1 conserved hypothetical protein [Nitrospina gracilis 3/211]